MFQNEMFNKFICFITLKLQEAMKVKSIREKKRKNQPIKTRNFKFLTI